MKWYNSYKELIDYFYNLFLFTNLILVILIGLYIIYNTGFFLQYSFVEFVIYVVLVFVLGFFCLIYVLDIIRRH
jgi:hypothetical protein